MTDLNAVLEAKLGNEGADFYRNLVPASVYSALKPSFKIRPYQEEAFGRFVYYLAKFNNKPEGIPTHLLFHMATGSGKTLVMAGLIAYLYEQGYRNFLFFVNSTNIIDKTRDNFLNPASSKYLFAESISIQGNRVPVVEVDNFDSSQEKAVNIAFTTIQGLHIRLTQPKENAITYEDFEHGKTVLISDEAHHINADTRKKAELADEERSWESTVKKVLAANKDNILLEFTATADLSNPQIRAKYTDKLIFDYPLKQFRKDGYSKEVKVFQSELPLMERAIQAVLLSQYRRKIFEKYDQPVKPVILFKSKTIKESLSFHNDFARSIKNLTAGSLDRIRNNTHEGPVQAVFEYLQSSGVSLDNFVLELKEDFSEEKLLIVNSKEESELKQIAVNTLEDENNTYRAVFAVDKLNEGWDVLNLFDIVRLYDTRDASKGKPGKTTMSEAQLIGRGARYFPFSTAEGQMADRRKFDNDTSNEVRICEELYYHSAYNLSYIRELYTALVKIGIRAEETARSGAGKAFKPESINVTGPDEANTNGKSFWIPADHIFKVELKTGYSRVGDAFVSVEDDGPYPEKQQGVYRLCDMGENVLRKAMNRLEFYHFSNLNKYLPKLQSTTEFINSDSYLGTVRVQVSGAISQLSHLSAEDRLEVCMQVLNSISSASLKL